MELPQGRSAAARGGAERFFSRKILLATLLQHIRPAGLSTSLLPLGCKVFPVASPNTLPSLRGNGLPSG